MTDKVSVPRRIAGPGPHFEDLAVTRDGSRLALASSAAVTVYEVASGARLRRFEYDYVVERRLALSPDGSKVLIGRYQEGCGGEIKAWDVATGQCLWEAGGDYYGKDLWALGWSRDGSLVAAALRESEHGVHLWSADSGEELAQVGGEWGSSYGLAFGPRRELAVCTGDVTLYTTRPIAPEPSLETSNGDVYAVAFNEAGDRFAAQTRPSQSEPEVYVWSWPERRLIASWPVTDGYPDVLDFDTDGRLLVRSEDGLVLCDAPTGEPVAELRADRVAMAVATPVGVAVAYTWGGLDWWLPEPGVTAHAALGAIHPDTETKAFELLYSLQVPTRLIRYATLVREAGEQLLERLAALQVPLRDDLVRVGIILHGVGTSLHATESPPPGAEHDATGEHLLLERAVSPEIARMCVSHARWAEMDVRFEDLLVALASKLWKGERHRELEERVIEHAGVLAGRERSAIAGPLASAFEAIASAGAERSIRGA